MADSPRSPWLLSEVPPTEDGRSSRWPASLPSGFWPENAGQQPSVLAHVLNTTTANYRLTQETLTPNFTSVNLYCVVKDGDEYKLLPRGTLRIVPMFKNLRPGSMGKCKLKAGAALDALAMREAEGMKLTDYEAFKALLDYVSEKQPTLSEVQALNDALALALAQRAGITVTRLELPGYGRPHEGSTNGTRN